MRIEDGFNIAALLTKGMWVQCETGGDGKTEFGNKYHAADIHAIQGKSFDTSATR